MALPSDAAESMSLGWTSERECRSTKRATYVLVLENRQRQVWRSFRVNRNKVSYFEMSGAGKIDLPSFFCSIELDVDL